MSDRYILNHSDYLDVPDADEDEPTTPERVVFTYDDGRYYSKPFGDQSGEYVRSSDYEALQSQLTHILEATGGEIRNGILTFSPEKYAAWCRKKGGEKTQQIVAENSHLQNLLIWIVGQCQSSDLAELKYLKAQIEGHRVWNTEMAEVATLTHRMNLAVDYATQLDGFNKIINEENIRLLAQNAALKDEVKAHEEVNEDKHRLTKEIAEIIGHDAEQPSLCDVVAILKNEYPALTQRAEAAEKKLSGYEHSIACIQERAAVFAKPRAGSQPRKSAVEACSWIKAECDGLLNGNLRITAQEK